MFGQDRLSGMDLCRQLRPRACWASRFDISTGLLADIYSQCAGIDGSTFGFLKLLSFSAKGKYGFEGPEGRNLARRGVIRMPTKADLEHRVAVLEEALEEACDLIKDVLETEDETEGAD